MKLNYLDQRIGELITSPENKFESVDLVEIKAFKERILNTLKDTDVTLKKVVNLADFAEKTADLIRLSPEIKLALVTAFIKDLVQACLDRTAAIAEKSKKAATKERDSKENVKSNDVNVDEKRVTHYSNELIVKIDNYKFENDDSSFKISEIKKTGDIPKKLKIQLRDGIFANEKDMDNESEVLAARTALKRLMPLASDASIGSFYAHVSENFRKKRNA